MSLVQHMSETVKHGIDYLSVGAIVASLLSWVPQVSAVLAALWFALRLVIGWQEYLLNRRKLRGKE